TVDRHSGVQLRTIGRAAYRATDFAHDIASDVEANDVVAPSIPRADQPTVRRDRHIVKTDFAVLDRAERLSRFAVIARDDATLRDVDDACAIYREAAQRHFRISRPLMQKSSRGIEYLHAPAAVFD